MTVDQNVLSLARNRIKIELSERNDLLNKNISQVIAQMNARGVLHSSMTIQELAKVRSEEIKERINLAWETLYRFITTAGVSYSDDLADELKNVITGCIPEDLRGIKESPQKLMTQPTILSDLHRKSEVELYRARVNKLQIINTEIDLFVHHLKNKDKEAEQGAKQTIYINAYSTVGTIQTGDYSTATVTQTVNPQHRKEIVDLLKEIEHLISQNNILPERQKEEIIEIISDGQKEIQKKKPNISKFKSYMLTTGVTIRTIASLKPLYDMLKASLIPLGVNLP